MCLNNHSAAAPFWKCLECFMVLNNDQKDKHLEKFPHRVAKLDPKELSEGGSWDKMQEKWFSESN